MISFYRASSCLDSLSRPMASGPRHPGLNYPVLPLAILEAPGIQMPYYQSDGIDCRAGTGHDLNQRGKNRAKFCLLCIHIPLDNKLLRN